jgi:hypothetical protein
MFGTALTWLDVSHLIFGEWEIAMNEAYIFIVTRQGKSFRNLRRGWLGIRVKYPCPLRVIPYLKVTL